MTEKQPMQLREAAPHFKTGIVGLDDLLRGGIVFPKSKGGLIVLLKGLPGTGKTTLAFQLLKAASGWNDEARDGEVARLDAAKRKLEDKQNPLYQREIHQYETAISWTNEVFSGVLDATGVKIYSCEQDADDLKMLCDRLGISQDTISITGRPYGHNMISEAASGELGSRSGDATGTIYKSWFREVKRKISTNDEKSRLLIVDGLNLLAEGELGEDGIDLLVHQMRTHAWLGIIVYEGEQGACGSLDYIADMVIELQGQEMPGSPPYFLNRLQVSKARFQRSALGWHQYKIRTSTGIVVFQSPHFRVSRKDNSLDEQLDDSMKSIVYKDQSQAKREQSQAASVTRAPVAGRSVLGALLGAEPQQGSCTVVLGARRTWKTLLTFDFLRAGSLEGETGLLVSIMDNQSTIIDQRKSLCRWYGYNHPNCADNNACYENISLLHFRPGCVASGEFFHYISERIERGEAEKKKVKRLLFWDLTQLGFRFPLLSDDPLFLPLLMDHLKHTYSVTSLFMTAPNPKIAECASAIADNVVYCWQDEQKSALGAKRNGVALWVDRLEGGPESGQLFFMQQGVGDKRAKAKLNKNRKADNESAGRVQAPCPRCATDPKERKPIANLPTPADPGRFIYAESMIDRIRATQGLPAERSDAH